MKAVLVIDMPNVCENCLLNIDDLCAGTREPVHSISCPLKPMPKKQEHRKGLCSDFILGFEDGWNECLEEIEE